MGESSLPNGDEGKVKGPRLRWGLSLGFLWAIDCLAALALLLPAALPVVLVAFRGRFAGGPFDDHVRLAVAVLGDGHRVGRLDGRRDCLRLCRHRHDRRRLCLPGGPEEPLVAVERDGDEQDEQDDGDDDLLPARPHGGALRKDFARSVSHISIPQ